MSKLRRMRPIMGTFVEIGIETNSSNPQLSSMNTAFAEIETIDRLMSFHQADSDLTRLNQSNGEWLEVHPYTYQVLTLAKQMMDQTQQAFNCTVGGVMVSQGLLPNHHFESYLLAGDSHDLELEAGRVRLRRRVLITLDGIAKGFAIDKAVESLQANLIHSGWVNAGGDLRVFGETRMPIHRRELNEELSYIGHQKNTAIATSSVEANFNERFPGMMIDRNHQFKPGIWTVKAPQAWVADALTKVVACLPAEKIKTLLPQFSAELVYGLSV